MIKDKMQLQGFNTIKLPKIKGEVEIKLHNPTTGKTEIHRGENMVTNAVSDIFASNYCGALDYRKCLPLYSNMFGGILCFKEAFAQADMVATDYFIPDNSNGQAVTAHAGQSTVTDQSDDPSRGSMSVNNMSVTDGTVKLAWEWGLSEGNGKISALALTHSDTGTMGTGTDSTIFQSTSPYINAYFGNTTLPTHNYSVDTTKNHIYFVGIDGYGYRFSASGTTVTIYKIVMPYAQTGLIAEPFLDSGITTHTVTTTTSFSSQPGYFYDSVNNLLWLLNSTSTTSVAYEKINMSTFEISAHGTMSFTDTISLNCASVPIVVPFDGTYMYLKNAIATSHSGVGCDYFIKVNTTNLTDKTKISATQGAYASGGIANPNKTGKVLAGQGFVINNNKLYCTGTSAPAEWWTNFERTPIMEQRIGLAQITSQFSIYMSAPAYWVAISKFYLATKFNLTSAVTKQPSQSMIVTYTLTEVAPNE